MAQDFDFLHRSFDAPNFESEVKRLPQIVFVEDDPTLGNLLKKYFDKKFSTEIKLFTSPNECLNGFEKEFGVDGHPFCLITDISFEDGVDGLLLIDMFREKKANFVAIAMTGFASIETAINATKKGVFHYLTKPFDFEDLEKLILDSCQKSFGLCQAFVEELQGVAEVAPISDKKSIGINKGKFQIELPREEDIFMGMIGRNRKMRSVFERIQKVAESDSTVFINGPSGTGKELIANAIHELSSRFQKRIVSVNCGAIPPDLLESELFGHVKGAFTGAISDRKGRFELADEGTIFLDEIGDMPLLLQVKMLRVLQNQQVEPVGSSVVKNIDTRIITATHKDLDELVERGDFREDLYYRLNVIPISVPSLKERRDDIPLLVGHFLKRYVSADGRNSIEFDENALELLMGYDWPGNVRELENLIERLVILRGGSTIKASDLPAKFMNSRPNADYYESVVALPEDGMDLKLALSEIEDSLISQALRRTKGNKNQASKLLHMNRTTLIEKLKKKSIQL